MFEVIQTVENQPVNLAIEVFPEGLSWDAVRIFKDLDDARKKLDSEPEPFKTVDIKEKVFEAIDKKENKIPLDLDNNKAVIYFKYDIPEEIVFKKYKKEITDVIYFYMENDNVIYNTGVYIKLSNGEWFIRTNKYSGVTMKTKR